MAREALLEAARTEFARAGLEHARIEDVARRAGVSKGAFYLHFESKEAAFREILQRFLGVLEEQTRRSQEAEERFERDFGRPGTSASLEQLLESDCRIDAELLEVLWRNRLILAALDRGAGRACLELAADFRRRLRQWVVSRIAVKQSAGWLRRDVDAEVAGDVIVGAYESYGRRMVDLRAKPDLAAWARAFLVLFYQGLFQPAASQPGASQATAMADRLVIIGGTT
jgi:AcrR family transcriptional regulator